MGLDDLSMDMQEKARRAKTLEELEALAKESGRELSDEEIRGYIATGEPMDKAGAYGVQGKGAVFVEHLDGDFFNVMGLPLCTLAQMLKQQGVEVF